MPNIEEIMHRVRMLQEETQRIKAQQDAAAAERAATENSCYCCGRC